MPSYAKGDIIPGSQETPRRYGVTLHSVSEYAATFRKFVPPVWRNDAETPPSGVRSVSPINSVVIDSYGKFSSSATICLKAVVTELWPKSDRPVRIVSVLSALGRAG